MWGGEFKKNGECYHAPHGQSKQWVRQKEKAVVRTELKTSSETLVRSPPPRSSGSVGDSALSPSL